MLHILWIVLIIAAMMGTVVFASDTKFHTRTREMNALEQNKCKDDHRIRKDSHVDRRKHSKSTEIKSILPQHEEIIKQLGPCRWNSIKVEKYQIAEKYKIRIAEADPKYLYSMNYAFPHINSIIREQKACDDPMFKVKPHVPQKYNP